MLLHTYVVHRVWTFAEHCNGREFGSRVNLLNCILERFIAISNQGKPHVVYNQILEFRFGGIRYVRRIRPNPNPYCQTLLPQQF